MLLGTEEQKRTWLPKLATRSLSAFCLSEPRGGQQTKCEVLERRAFYVLNGEKKWATWHCRNMFTVIARQKRGGAEKRPTSERITALSRYARA